MAITKAAALNIAFYIFISLNPYIRWMLPSEIFYTLFLITTFIITLQIKNKIPFGIIVNNVNLRIAILLIIYLIYFTTPLIHEFRIGHLLWPIPFLFILFYNDKIIFNSYLFLKKIFLWIALFSLIFWVIKLFNIPLPYYTYRPDFRYNPSDYYKIYGLAISLYTGSAAEGSIFGIERITGVFAEPGHFGIYLGLILAIEKFNFVKRSNKILLITGLLTFSTAFYGIFILGLIYRLLYEKKISRNIFYPAVIIIMVSIIGVFIAGTGYGDLIYGRVLGRINNPNYTIIDIVDSRISENFIDNFQTFTQKSDLYIGYGYLNLDFPTTNWRGLIYRFGIIGLIIIILFGLSIVKRVNTLYAIILFAILLLILAHRSYLLYSPAIYLLLYVATSASKCNK